MFYVPNQIKVFTLYYILHIYGVGHLTIDKGILVYKKIKNGILRLTYLCFTSMSSSLDVAFLCKVDTISALSSMYQRKCVDCANVHITFYLRQENTKQCNKLVHVKLVSSVGNWIFGKGG